MLIIADLDWDTNSSNIESSTKIINPSKMIKYGKDWSSDDNSSALPPSLFERTHDDSSNEESYKINSNPAPNQYHRTILLTINNSLINYHIITSTTEVLIN